VALVVAAPATAGQPVGSPAAREALAQCESLADQPTSADWDRLTRALELAEQAVAADDRDAKAHFAVFCNLAKRTHVSGFTLRSLLAVRRLHSEIDRTLELAPDYTDALVAKGTFLLNLPRLLGGDVQEAERLLRRALAAEPDRIAARLSLAQVRAARGDREDALTEARLALRAALDADRPAQAQEARALIARLGG
jgi:tetratricopeptide (TPR) repeat protein